MAILRLFSSVMYVKEAYEYTIVYLICNEPPNESNKIAARSILHPNEVLHADLHACVHLGLHTNVQSMWRRSSSTKKTH